MDYIKLKERKDILRLGIVDEDGNIAKDDNGKEICLEFVLGDVDLPLNYNKCVTKINDAERKLKAQIIAIDKKQDIKKKNALLSANDEAKAKALKEFYKQLQEAMDLFLGEGGTAKFLNGRKPYYEMFDDLSEALEPYQSKLKLTMSDMTDRIKNKYKLKEKDDEVLTDE